MTTTLRVGQELHSDSVIYRIESVLGQGSFGVTYKAKAFMLMKGKFGEELVEIHTPKAIKEFFMKEINTRDASGSIMGMSEGSLSYNYAQKFKKEAENLAGMNHPNIVKVIDFITANNTFYYVMDYIDGESLDDYIQRNNGIPEDKALPILNALGSAIQYMHAHKMLHLDLKPKNVMLDKNGKCYLIDFGLSKQYTDDGEPESSTTIGAGTPGYAPIEQVNYKQDGSFPTTLDVYALGATMFKTLTGKRPPEASAILNNGFPLFELQEHHISDSLSASIAKAMAPIKKDRYQSIAEFLASLGNEETTIVNVADKEDFNKHPHVKAYYILPGTSRVRIEYAPIMPVRTGCFIALITKNDIGLGKFTNETFIRYPFDEQRYKKFLSDLQHLSLSMKDEVSYDIDEYSEPPERLIITLFDSQGKEYARYWMGSYGKNEYGNIQGDLHELRTRIVNITPQLHEYLAHESQMQSQAMADFLTHQSEESLPMLSIIFWGTGLFMSAGFMALCPVAGYYNYLISTESSIGFGITFFIMFVGLIRMLQRDIKGLIAVALTILIVYIGLIYLKAWHFCFLWTIPVAFFVLSLVVRKNHKAAYRFLTNKRIFK